MRFFDSHTHLNDERLSADLEGVLGRARDAGVGEMLIVGYTVESSLRAVELATTHEGLYAAVGVAPHDAHTATDADLAVLEALAGRPRVVAIGETGLEGHYRPETLDTQTRVLEAHAAIACRHGLPLVIHLREATERFVRWLDGQEAVAGIMHCYSGDAALARCCLARGLYISFAGPVSFKNAHALRAACAEVPPERLLIETDAPYLAPGKYRGQKPCEPFMLPETARAVAGVLGVTLEAVAETSRRNTLRVLGISSTEP